MLMENIKGYVQKRSFAQIKWQCLMIFIFAWVASPKASEQSDKHHAFELNKVASERWHLWRQTDALALYYQEVEGTPLIEIKVQATLNSSLAGFLLFLQDYPMIPNWLDRAESATLISQVSDTENLFITRFKSVWPVSKREMIIRSRYWQNADLSVELAVKDASHEVPIHGEIIRIKVIRSHWLLKPISNNRLQINHTILADPKGNLPIWLVNQVSLRSMWASLQAMQQQLPLSPWQSMGIPWIQEMKAKPTP